MSARSLLRRGLHGIKNVDVWPPKGIVGHGVDMAVGYGASYALGQAHIQWRDSESWWARNATKITAVVGKLGAIAIDAVAGPGYVASGVNAAGQAAVNAIGLQKGIEHALKRTHRQVAITPPGVSFDPAKLPPGTRPSTVLGDERQTVLGEIPPADPAGRWLNREQIDRIAEMH